MSCVGKSTFAKLAAGIFSSHSVVEFDRYFPWFEFETLQISIGEAFKPVAGAIGKHERCIVDGWHLCDRNGLYFPSNCKTVLLYGNMEEIQTRYKDHVISRDHMYERWYGNQVNYDMYVFSGGGRFTVVDKSVYEKGR